jgi:hypothetical protein
MTDTTEKVTPIHTQTAYAMADATGKLTVTGIVPYFMIADQKPPAGGSLALGHAEHGKHYIVNGAIKERPTNPTTLSGMKLLSIPNPSSVTIAGESPHEVTDGEVDLEFTQPGTYTVTVSSWPALDAVFEVTQS